VKSIVLSLSKPLSGKNIAIVANTAWNVQHFRLHLAKFLLANGAGKVIGMAPAGDEKTKIEEAGIQFVELKELARRSTNPILDLRLVSELSRNFKKNDVDLALLFTPKPSIYGSLAGRRANIPTVATITGLGYAFISRPILRRIVSQLYRVSLKRSRITVFQNEDDRELFVSKRMIAKEQTTIIHGSGVDTKRFSAVSKPRSDRSGIKFLFVGRFLIDKGIVELLSAAKRHLRDHPQNEFHLVGATDEGNPASLSKQDVDEWKQINNIFFHGYQPEVLGYLSDCDVLVLPSYREGMPRVVLEAMSMGKPCIVTDVPGCRDTIEHNRSGLLVEAKDSAALVQAFVDLSSRSAEDLIKMGQIARQRAVDIFSLNIVNDRYLDLITKIFETTDSKVNTA